MPEKQDAPTQRFARYRPTERFVKGRHAWAAPEGGLCLSAYLVLRPRSQPESVLLGRPDPSVDWEPLAALQTVHLQDVGERWILPASHLIEFESPSDAAHRVLREQLGLTEFDVPKPEVFTESYTSTLDPEAGTHWDFQFVFRGEWPDARPPRALVWKELAFRPARDISRSEIARGHADVLALAGYRFRD
jgi:ADP-ribose pyrophosphatase YjhB (NUDIX family)